MKKFQNKYRIPSARLQNWDYGANGAYFITICTDKMKCLFGDVVSNADVSNANVETLLIASLRDTIDEKCAMQLNELGKIAHDIWEDIPNKFPFVELGNFVIMPNHMHGILIINKYVQTRLIASKNENVENANANAHVETRLIAPVHDDDDDDKKGGFSGNNNPMFHENISRIIRWYKGRCSFEMRKIHADFNWQSRFYDHIIRDSRAFDTIQNYIEDNPSKWNKDKFHKKK
ncbi:REP element-mobilizing transposase RayT [Flavobacterium succinicans]|uniref:REP element-mobilizing transposase RayT n=1 Tax=Flavobacterium succinicans TaxID=29536 RepID=A0A1I4TKD3_9FLAO|nr:transposase [Flavobacterium succinicans]SFM77238.1 REP element-mobilizing transposase RayT [Flavobacterium succinicans]